MNDPKRNNLTPIKARTDCSQGTDCYNCGKPHTSAFCPHCGTKRIKTNGKDLFKELFFIITDLERRFVHTIKLMVIDPEMVINDYISGKRAPYFPLFRYLMLMLLLSYLWFSVSNQWHSEDTSLYTSIKNNMQSNSAAIKKAGKVFIEENYKVFYNEFIKIMTLFFKVISLIGIPCGVISTLLFYRKLKFNLAGHFIANTYMVSTAGFFSVILQPILSLFPLSMYAVANLTLVPTFIYYSYAFYKIGKPAYGNSKLRAFFASTFGLIIFTILNISWGMLVTVYIFSYVPSVFQ